MAGNVLLVALTTAPDQVSGSRVVAAVLGAVLAIFAALVVLVVAAGAAGFAVRWALTLGG